MEPRLTLTEWSRRVCAELELTDELAELSKDDVDRILNLAKDAAHAVARPAAPVTTFLLGFAVARGADPDRAAELVSRLAAAQKTEPGEPA